MSKVICDLPHAGEEINGFKFTKTPEGGMISEELPDDAFDLFMSIPGYRDPDVKVPEPEPAPAPVAPKPVLTPAAAKAAKAAADAAAAAAPAPAAGAEGAQA